MTLVEISHYFSYACVARGPGFTGPPLECGECQKRCQHSVPHALICHKWCGHRLPVLGDRVRRDRASSLLAR